MAPGADEGFTAYCAAHRDRLVRAVRPLAGEAAEDVAQEALLELHRHWEQVSRYDAPWAWLLLVARRGAGRRRARDARRTELERTTAVSAPGASSVDGPPDVDLRTALAGLPPRQATALLVHHVHDRPLSDVAALLGCSEPAARVLVHRARHLVAARLAGYAGRWVSETSWTADRIVARLGQLGAGGSTGVVLEEHLGGRGGRWELRVGADGYRLSRDDGLRLDEGTLDVRRGSLVLQPRLGPGTVSLGVRTDGERLDVRVGAASTPPTDGVPDEVWLGLFLGSGTMVWAGR